MNVILYVEYFLPEKKDTMNKIQFELQCVDDKRCYLDDEIDKIKKELKKQKCEVNYCDSYTFPEFYTQILSDETEYEHKEELLNRLFTMTKKLLKTNMTFHWGFYENHKV